MSQDPPYLANLRPLLKGKSDGQIEMWLACQKNIERKTGLTQHDHRMRALSRLFPDRIHHDWRERVVRGYQVCRDAGIKEYMVAGSSNSNKTSTFSDLALELWWEQPEVTTIYIASPYKEATQVGLWARILEQFDSATSLDPKLPGRVKPSDNKIVLDEKNPLAFIQVVTVDDIGKLVGKKSKDFGRGLMLIMIDELPALPGGGRALLSVMSNLRSVPNMMLIGAGNFAEIDDGMGRFCEPSNGYDSIKHRIDDLHEWKTRRGGLVYRFDGHQSPNVRAGKDIYPFVTTIAYLEDLAKTEGGINTAGYYRYGRSFPMMDMSEFTVLNSSKLDAGRCSEDVVWLEEPFTYGAFCDPGFGGDPTILQPFRFGWAMLGGKRTQVFDAWMPPHLIPILIGKKDEEGNELTAERQVVEGCMEYCEANGIPPEHFGFDGSMRAGIVQEFLTRWSLLVNPVDFGGLPTERPISAVKEAKTWREVVMNFVSELWFATASVVQSGQFRGIGLVPKAREQLCRRRWSYKGLRKKQVETKDEYKSSNENKSPNEADALVGCVEMARRLGFVLDGVAPGGSGVMELHRVLSEIANRAKVKRYLENKLPSGRLHDTSGGKHLGRAHLNSNFPRRG